MVNNYTAFGTYNKKSVLFTQQDDGSTPLINFANITEAKNYFLTAEAQAVHNDCCTELQWAIVDSTNLKVTYTFGVKEDPDAEQPAVEFHRRKDALRSSDPQGWMATPYLSEEVETHLF